MTITITAGRWATKYFNTAGVTLTLGASPTVLDAINALSIPPDEVGFATLNGTAIGKDYPLTEGLTINLHPTIVGG